MDHDNSSNNSFIFLFDILASTLFVGSLLAFCDVIPAISLNPLQLLLILVLCFFWLVYRQIGKTDKKQRDVFISHEPIPGNGFEDLPFENTRKRDFKSFAIINFFALALMSLFGPDPVYNPFLAICIMLAFYFPFLGAVSWILYRRLAASEAGLQKTSLPRLYAKASIVVPVFLVFLVSAFPVFMRLEMAVLMLFPFLVVALIIMFFSAVRGIGSLISLPEQIPSSPPPAKFRPLPTGQILFIAILCPLLFGLTVATFFMASSLL